MGRANQLASGGGIFHVTHRCHNRAFLLKFACDRDAYRTMLREQLRPFDVWLLDYCVTSNHVHLLIYHEIMGKRRRYRLVDLERLCWRLGTGDLQEIRDHLEASLEEANERTDVHCYQCFDLPGLSQRS